MFSNIEENTITEMGTTVGLNNNLNNVQNEVLTEIEAIKEKPYRFRKLNATDIGSLVRVIRKIDIKRIKNIFDGNQIKEAMSKVMNSQNKVSDDATKDSSNKLSNDVAMAVGIEMITSLIPIILDSYSDCEHELFELLSNTSNLELEEVKSLDFDIFFEMLFDFFKKDEFMGFLKRVLKLMNLD